MLPLTMPEGGALPAGEKPSGKAESPLTARMRVACLPSCPCVASPSNSPASPDEPFTPKRSIRIIHCADLLLGPPLRTSLSFAIDPDTAVRSTTPPSSIDAMSPPAGTSLFMRFFGLAENVSLEAGERGGTGDEG